MNSTSISSYIKFTETGKPAQTSSNEKRIIDFNTALVDFCANKGNKMFSTADKLFS